jgi:hypothetical protein
MRWCFKFKKYEQEAAKNAHKSIAKRGKAVPGESVLNLFDAVKVSLAHKKALSAALLYESDEFFNLVDVHH